MEHALGEDEHEALFHRRPRRAQQAAERKREHERDDRQRNRVALARAEKNIPPVGHVECVGRGYWVRNWSLLRAAIAMIVPCGLTPGASGSNDASLTRRFVKPQTRPKLSAPVRVAVLADANGRREVHRHQVGAVARRGIQPLHEILGPRATTPPVTDGYISVAPGGEEDFAEVHERACEPAHVAFGEVVGHQRRRETRAAPITRPWPSLRIAA